jgi:hypothetical protein
MKNAVDWDYDELAELNGSAPADLAEHRKALDATYELDEPPSSLRVHSTPATRERYAFLKSKKEGAVWEEGGSLYRQGATGVTVFKPGGLVNCFSA